ncbi:MAG: MBL fold metallo-hydrolase [Deltaproteobacteria bacterium]|nr:MBL fold metallo-hydrolase [Deltaproteobacteria bacterium]
MWNLNVKVIKSGTCTIDPGNSASPVQAGLKYQLGIGGGSSVTVIREGQEVLLVDTGFDQEGDASIENKSRNLAFLEGMLALKGIRLQEITRVFVTHFHADHCNNLEYFDQAQWYALDAALAELKGPGKDRFTSLKNGEEILPQTLVVHTPGHTKGHASLHWSDGQGKIKVAICGDAIINLAWLQSGYVWKFNGDFYNQELARESSSRLLQQADILIPGHGQPFFKPARFTGVS